MGDAETIQTDAKEAVRSPCATEPLCAFQPPLWHLAKQSCPVQPCHNGLQITVHNITALHSLVMFGDSSFYLGLAIVTPSQ